MKTQREATPTVKVSYAQNAEDIVLSRAFSDIDEGFYVDVGANDPAQHSVTKYFYDLGWQGINIEPSAQYQKVLRTHRLRDINLSCLAGEKDGEATFYEIENTGLSTAKIDLLRSHEERGFRGTEKRLQVRSLRSILNEFSPPVIHFLKIDVEGFEMQVLRGGDWRSYRPWVILVETTVPLEGGMEDPEILDFLREQDYRHCFFDGVNSYFVAGEHAELMRHFRSPANALDHFLSAGFVHLLSENKKLLEERSRFLDEMREASKQQADKLAATRGCLADMQSSLCWKLTTPVRILDGLLRHRAVTLKALRDFFSARLRIASPSPDRAIRIPAILPSIKTSGNGEGSRADWSALRYPLQSKDSGTWLTSCLCTKAQLGSPAFRFWLERIEAPFRTHRKLWEFAYIIQALFERGCLARGRRGLGFAVGEEPLPALFASMGCFVTATDLNPDDERAKPWAETAQLASSKEKLSKPTVCPESLFEKRVTYRHVDMNRIPADLADFDFTWSSCSFEHCGSIDLGLAFVEKQMACLKPGGVAVHTTEFNLSSDDQTLTEGSTVIFRKRDIEDLVDRLRVRGHHVERLDYQAGGTKEDELVDVFPYGQDPHLKLLLADKYVSTSIGLIVRRGHN